MIQPIGDHFKVKAMQRHIQIQSIIPHQVWIYVLQAEGVALSMLSETYQKYKNLEKWLLQSRWKNPWSMKTFNQKSRGLSV